MNEFWTQVCAAAIGFAPSAILIYMMGYREGKKDARHDRA